MERMVGKAVRTLDDKTTVLNFDSIKRGDRFVMEQEVTREKVMLFAQASGDFSLLHSDPQYALNTRFGKVIAHGMLTGGFISAALAGLGKDAMTAVYLEQFLKFHRPVVEGDILRVYLKITCKNNTDKSLCLTTDCYNRRDRLVVSGRAKIRLDPYPYPQAA
ncbi:MaoC family dehydratase [Candidatus Daviesbacteria bacterium]|nr:MaoC family dehydratase [Candidatus Daviesbacteria bacterium]